MMTFRWLLLGLLLATFVPQQAQAQDEVDVTKLLADTKTFIFNNNKNTVKGYIYSQLESQTSCCNQDRIYLEVKIDPSGYVLQVKSLTGKNDCYMQSAGDIIKNIKWDARDFKGPKSVYFEIKPNIDCDNRNNNYAQVRIFNNEKVDAQGNRIYASNPRPSASESAANGGTPPPATAATTPPATTTTPAISEPVAAEPEATVNKEPAVVSSPPQEAETTPPPAQTTREPDPVVSTPPQTQPQEVSPPPTEPTRSAAETLPMASTVQPSPIAAADEERQRAQQVADQQSVAREEEIRFLKEQLETMRQREEELRETRLAQEQAAREAARQEAQYAANQSDNVYDSTPAYEDNNGSNPDYVGKEGEGGLWFADSDGNTGGDNSLSEPTQPTDPPKAQTEEERLRNQMASVEQKIREMEQKQLERERIMEQQMMENERDRDEILRLVEQKLMLEEDMAQREEDKELDQLTKEQTQIEDETARTEDESQRLIDELARLQVELEDKMQAIQDKKSEIQNMAELKTRREQEITLARAIREKEREAELLQYRMDLQGTSSSGVSIADGSNSNLTLENLPPDFLDGSPQDSAKLALLLATIEQMRVEMQRLQIRIVELEGGDPSSIPQTPAGNRVINSGTNTSGGVNHPWQNRTTPLPSGARSAADDESWKPIDNGIDLPVEPVPQVNPAATSSSNTNQPAGDLRPDVSHRDTHANVAGPRFTSRTYAEGEGVVKEKIKTQLRSANVCGLAQAAFSVTLSPDGSVVAYNVLASNKPQVQTALMKVIPTLKFNGVGYAYNQVVYLDFKADVACDGVDDNTNLKDVNSLIKNP